MLVSSLLIMICLGVMNDVLASPKAVPPLPKGGSLPQPASNETDLESCATPTATAIVTALQLLCLYVCEEPTSICTSGEPTGPTPHPPQTETVASNGDCTAILEIYNVPGCTNCPTCRSSSPSNATMTTSVNLNASSTSVTATPIKTARSQTHTLTKHNSCKEPTATIHTTPTLPPTAICHCPMIKSACTSGQSKYKPLPSTTHIGGCEKTVIVGPGDCSNRCEQCS
ncbi:hypothetical protein BD289DRAFT_425190 [Coniella lustricola]|uniref:Uncharacterized protein n=1 Tax=Coniella lustricola TaxID=2025994 RepID=A0A2T3AHV2_9PEZI|nr:hypothetical protein BD289DRAFT_425190 [Coniella lustricola]